MTKIEWTPMLKRYLVKFAVRIAIFLFILSAYLWNKQLLYDFVTKPVYYGIEPIHIPWFVFMTIMLVHIFPGERLTMALRKGEKYTYKEASGYKEIDLLTFVKEQNVKAWTVMLVWLSLNAVFGLLYLFQIADEADLLMLTVFFFLCDYICILLFCPFQTHIMKNRCCVNCRIYDWGHFMMFTPMLFIRNFFSWTPCQMKKAMLERRAKKMNLFKMKYDSLVEGSIVEDPNGDVKSGKTIGQYKVTDLAIYRPDGKYIPFKDVEEIVQDKGTVHVTGCCIGAVAVDRLLLTAGGKKYAFAFDSDKDAKTVRAKIEGAQK